MLDRLRPFADALLGLALVAAVDLWAFHAGAYYSWLRPDSYSGRVEETSRRFAALRAATPDRQVVVMSNSTGGACVTEQLVENELRAAGWPLAVANLSAGGSTARSWYHLLRHEAVRRDTTAAVVLGVHPQGLTEDADNPDLEIVKTRLALSDAAVLPWSYAERERQLQVFTQVFFRTPFFRDDLRDFLHDPPDRLAAAALARKEEERFAKGWRRAIGRRIDLTSARLDAAGKLDLEALSPRLRENRQLVRQLDGLLQRRAARGNVPGAPMTLETEQAAMLRKTVEMLGARGVPVVVAITPQSPFPLPGHRIDPLERLIAELRAEGHQVALFHDLAMLDVVESPEHFSDLLHVNAGGAEIYSRGLAAFLARAFGSELEIEERRGVLRGEQDRGPDQAGGGQAADS